MFPSIYVCPCSFIQWLCIAPSFQRSPMKGYSMLASMNGLLVSFNLGNYPVVKMDILLITSIEGLAFFLDLQRIMTLNNYKLFHTVRYCS